MLLGVLVIATGAAVARGDWPLERGGVESSGASSAALAASPELTWRYRSSGAGFEATPIIHRGVVYIGDNDGTFYALDVRDGSEIWKRQISGSGFLAAAGAAGAKVVVGDLDGTLYCINADDGNELWQFATESELYAGPNLYEGRVLVSTESGTLYCLRADSGDAVWPPYTIEAPLRCMPTIAAGRILLAGCDGQLHAVDVDTGQQVGTLDIGGPTGSTPAVFEGKAYFGIEDGVFYCIAVDAMSILWRFQDPQRRLGIRTAAAVNTSHVVFANQGRTVYALDAQTGAEVWQEKFRTRLESSPLIVGDRLVLATVKGQLVIKQLSSGRNEWEFDAGGAFYGSPAIVKNHLVLGNEDGTVYCFGQAAPGR